MNKFVTAATLAIVAVCAKPERVQAQTACELYRVVKGDSLRGIALTAYGVQDFMPIFKANAAAIGHDPNLIAVGTVLHLPCKDAKQPDEPELVTVSTPAGPETFELITANGYLPYADETLPGGGIITMLIDRAFDRADEYVPHRLTVINDRAAHLEALLPTHVFDASFPWTAPDCETLTNPTRAESYTCENYIYSAPFYEIVEGFFARTGSGYEDELYSSGLAGAVICRPEGYATGHLIDMDLFASETKLVQPVTIRDCFEHLMTGEVDLVSFDTRSGAQILERLGLTDSVSGNPNVVSIVPLQVAAHRDNPSSEILIAALNEGLREMQQSGEWQNLIRDALTEQIEK